MYLTERDMSGSGGFALHGVGPLPVAPARRRIRHFQCLPNELPDVRAVTRPDITVEEMRDALEHAAEQAVSLLRHAAEALRRGRRTPEIRAHFCECFGVMPEFVPSWRPPGQTWDRGGVVRTRLLRAAEILDGGFIRYFCWNGRTHCDPDCAPSTEHFACFGKYRVCLGQSFWEAVRDAHPTNPALTLLHEALHIYFEGLVVHGERGGSFGNAFCYERFVLRANGLDIPPGTDDRCQAFTDACR